MKAQRVSGSVAVLFLQPGRQMGCVINATPWLLYHRERPVNHCIGGGWAPGLFWTDAENLPLPGFHSWTAQE